MIANPACGVGNLDFADHMASMEMVYAIQLTQRQTIPAPALRALGCSQCGHTPSILVTTPYLCVGIDRFANPVCGRSSSAGSNSLSL